VALGTKTPAAAAEEHLGCYTGTCSVTPILIENHLLLKTICY
jgi:hypothetical protein